MKEFRIKLLDRPGELNRVTNDLAAQQTNLKGLAAVVSTPQPVIGVVGDDNDAIRQVLDSRGYEYEEHDLLMLSLPDEPGALARATQKLADSLVNVESVYLITKVGTDVQFGITVDNPEKARHALK